MRHAKPFGPGHWGGPWGIACKIASRLTSTWWPTDRDWPWAIAATGPGVDLVRREKIDLIWASAPYWTNFLLAHRIATRTGVPLVMDYRDIWLASGRNNSYERRYIKLETKMLQDTAGITFTAPRQEAVIDSRADWMRLKPRSLVHNWFDAQEDIGSEQRENEHPTILHGGTLYGGERRVEGLFDALAMLRRNGSQEVRSIRFVQLGGLDISRYGLARLGLEQAVEVLPPVPRLEFFARCRGARILLLAVGHDSGVHQHAGAIPGKLYDYLQVGRPILVIGPRDCSAAEIVTRCHRGLAAADDDVPAIAAAVEALLKGQGADGPLDMRPEAASEFEAANVVKKLAVFLDEVLSTARRESSK